MTSTQTHPLETTTLQGALLSHAHGTFLGANQTKLFYQSWYPIDSATATQADRGVQQAPCGAIPATVLDASKEEQFSCIKTLATHPKAADIKGVLAIVHGLGEHSGRYCSVVKAAVDAGYAVFGFDNQGHGKSEGQRGHIRSWQDYRDNVQSFLQLIRQQEPDQPLFVMGHSLGGLIVLDYVLRNTDTAAFEAFRVSGIIVSAPPMKPTGRNALRAILAKLLSGFLPRLSLKMCLDEGGLSRDRQVESQAQADPLVHPYVTLRWGTETMSTIAWVKKHIQQLDLPIMLTHGGADPIIDPLGSQDLFEAIRTPEKTLHIYPDSYHEPHNDLDADVVTADIVDWLAKLEG